LYNFCENSLIMTAQELTELLIENISMQLRHPNYDRCLQVRTDAKMISTSLGWESEVTRYRRFEEEVLKDQRVRLHNSPTKSALAGPRKLFRKLPRVEGVRIDIKCDTPKPLAELEKDYHNFQPGKSIAQWINETLEYLGVTDPNAWILAERHDTRNIERGIIKTKIYPVIFSSENVLNFQRTYGELEWVIFRTVRIERVREKNTYSDKVLEDYYLYAPGMFIRAREVGAKTVMEGGETAIDIPVYMGEGAIVNPALPGGKAESPATKSTQKPRQFYVLANQNGTTEVPAICAGVYPDETTDQQSFVPWFDPAQNDFKDLIRYKSTLDVLLAIHAYPKETVYTKACKFRHPEMGECEGGYFHGIHDRDHECTSCHGTGRMAGFTTEQAKIELILPDGATSADLIELSKLSYTQPVDTALLAWLVERIETTEAKITSTIFGAGTFQRPNFTKVKTATEVNEIGEGVADVLAPFGSHECRVFELFYRVGAQYRGFSLEVDRAMPDDLQVESLMQIVSVFDLINKSGLGFEATTAQRRRVLLKQFEGNPVFIKKIEARYAHKPFDDKSPEETALIISGLAPTDPMRVLWAYFIHIFAEIEAKDENFYLKSYDIQKGIVDKKVAEFAGRIVEVDMNSDAPSFNEPGNMPDNEPANADAQ